MKVARKILSYLSRFDDGATTTDLKESGIRGPTISTVMRKCAKAGLIERHETPGAHARFRITDAGRRFVKEAV
jgi:predicted transcriptional regulator